LCERWSGSAGLPEGVLCRVKCRNVDASKRILVATGILVFDFELFIGVRFCEAHTGNGSFDRRADNALVGISFGYARRVS